MKKTLVTIAIISQVSLFAVDNLSIMDLKETTYILMNKVIKLDKQLKITNQELNNTRQELKKSIEKQNMVLTKYIKETENKLDKKITETNKELSISKYKLNIVTNDLNNTKKLLEKTRFELKETTTNLTMTSRILNNTIISLDNTNKQTILNKEAVKALKKEQEKDNDLQKNSIFKIKRDLRILNRIKTDTNSTLKNYLNQK